MGVLLLHHPFIANLLLPLLLWVVHTADERLRRLEVLQQAPSTHPAAAAAAAALRPWSIMHVLTMNEASWSSGRRDRPKATKSSKVQAEHSAVQDAHGHA